LFRYPAVARKVLLGGVFLVILVTLYAAAGYWLAPRFVREALEDQAKRAGLELRMRAVRTDPFLLRVALSGVELNGSDGHKLAAAQAASADLAWSSLWRRAWTVKKLALQGGELHAPGVAIPVTDVRLDASGLSMAGPTAEYSIAARIAGGNAAARGTLALQPLAAHGKVDIDGAQLGELVRAAQPGVVLAPGTVSGSTSFAYENGRVTLEGTRAEAVQGHARLAAEGQVAVQPFAADLQVEAKDVDLRQAQHWLPPPLAIASGAFSGKGRLQVHSSQVTYVGTAAARDLNLEQRPGGALLLASALVETSEARLMSAPMRLEIGEVIAHAPHARLVIAKDGSLNVASAVNKESGTGQKAQWLLRRLRVQQGVLDFADESLDTPFSAKIRDLGGTVSGLGSEQHEPARVQLEGRVDPYGLARIRGAIELEAPKTLTNVTASFRNLDVAAFNPYAAKFAGYRIRSGRVSADLRYRVREGRVVGDNKLRFESLQLGEKVARAGVPDLPLELAVKVLADAQGRINVAIPVTGDLNSPHVDFGGLVANALHNVIGRVASAPFRMLARLAGENGEEPEEVRFEPGSVALTPPQEEALASVAKALAERPQLEFAVRGTYDPQADIEAMRRRAVRRDIVRAAGYELKGNEDPGVSFGDPKIVRAAESLYVKRVGNRDALAKLRAQPGYARALVDQLAAKMPVDPAAGEKLAVARAETVRAALVVNGVEAARVSVAPPQQQAADADGVPIVLALALASEEPRAARDPGMKVEERRK